MHYLLIISGVLYFMLALLASIFVANACAHMLEILTEKPNKVNIKPIKANELVDIEGIKKQIFETLNILKQSKN